MEGFVSCVTLTWRPFNNTIKHLMTSALILLWSGFFLLLFIGKSRQGRWLSPTVPVSLWWAIWLTISATITWDMYPPSIFAVYIVAIFVLSFFFGGILPNPDRILKSKRLVGGLVLSAPNFKRSIDAVFFVGLVAQIPVVIYLNYKSMQFFGTYLGGDIRASAIGFFGTGEDPIFGSSFIKNLYDLATSGFNFLTIGPAIYALFHRNKVWPLMLVLVVVLGNQMVTFGRANIYFTAIGLVCASLLLVDQTSWRRLLPKLSFVFIIVLAVASIYAAYSFSKREGEKRDERDFFVQYVDYHLLGFTLFSLEVEEPDSLTNKGLGFGIASTNGLQKIAGFMIRRIIPNWFHPGADFEYVNQSFREVGARDSKPMYYNAYYTIIHPLYYDGRLPLVVLFGALSGWLLNFSYNVYFFRRDCLSASVWIGVLLLGFYSLHHPPTERLATFTWIILILALSFRLTSDILQKVFAWVPKRFQIF